uniref:Uncharacterized protein n=1 Tax=Ectopseudomonas mendocina (strain ymp) TaxID=399739 RepID=A4Y099_ECTM1
MKPESLLLRQIHPSFVQEGRVTSQAFRPTPKDEFHLSVDNGDKSSAKDAWQRFINTPGCSSIGVQAVRAADCEEQELPVIEDGTPYPEHCSIDFSAEQKKSIERKAKALRTKAESIGWLHLVD